MSDLTYDVDISELTAGITQIQNKIASSKMHSILSIGFEIMRLSSMEVPHDKGSLQNSATVQEIDDTVVIGYHEPYAARLHEHPEYHFQKGRKGKYLSDPISNNSSILGLQLNNDFGKQLGLL